MRVMLLRFGVVLLVARLALDMATPFLPGAFVLQSSGGIEGANAWSNRTEGPETPRFELATEHREALPAFTDIPEMLVPRSRTIAPARRVEHPLRLPRASDGGAFADRSSDH